MIHRDCLRMKLLQKDVVEDKVENSSIHKGLSLKRETGNRGIGESENREMGMENEEFLKWESLKAGIFKMRNL